MVSDNKSSILKMSKRSQKNQTCHDISVRRRASQLETYGWHVQADLPDFDKPPTLNVGGKGVRPDIYAVKGKKKRIVEVETQETRFRDKPQHRLLREYGRNQKNTEVNVRTCYF